MAGTVHWFCFLSVFVAGSLFAQPGPLATLSEQSGFSRSGRHAEADALRSAFAQQHPQWLKCQSFGTLPQGRAMPVLVVSQSGALTPDRARAMKLPVTLMQVWRFAPIAQPHARMAMPLLDPKARDFMAASQEINRSFDGPA